MHARAPFEEDVEATVRELLRLDDRANACDVGDRRLLRLRVGAGNELDDGDHPVRIEGVFCHLPVARLEDVERHDGPRKQHGLRQREERQFAESGAEIRLLT